MLEPGDLVEINRTCYQHWALYVGDGYVIHLAPPSEDGIDGAHSIMSVATSKAKVKLELLKEVVGESTFQVNNKGRRRPLPIDEILRKARALVGEMLDYDVLRCNCEHFVTALRFGEARSDQVRQGMWAAGGTVVAVLGTLSAFAWYRDSNKKQEQ
ncbi:phospholipase A and acyltransferase 3-like [Lethenteron reissneri]|uniref:phospholipase A and acyltransferase 3-like n=1 Tax=Lethenteron reissneri TaxID=7753 RepID=UPI002AB6235E|nr:phospholipase A and acyltransferase 3-like [Lethenteron reissneri]